MKIYKQYKARYINMDYIKKIQGSYYVASTIMSHLIVFGSGLSLGYFLGKYVSNKYTKQKKKCQKKTKTTLNQQSHQQSLPIDQDGSNVTQADEENTNTQQTQTLNQNNASANSNLLEIYAHPAFLTTDK